MTSLLRRSLGRNDDATRSIGTVDDYLNALQQAQFSGGYGLPGMGVQQTLGGQTAEQVGNDFASMAGQVYGRNSVIFACMLARQAVFSQIRFQWQALNKGRPSELFSTAELGMFERPWEGATTADMLARTINDSDLSGNSYWTRYLDEMIRLRPDWVDIVLESRVVGRDGDKLQILGSRRIGYLYHEGGRGQGEPVPLPVTEVAHYAPIPDPLATFRGMSWLTPVIREVQADESMTKHKSKFFANGASPNMIVKHAPTVTPKQAREFKQALDEEYAGVENAYKVMHLGGGADATVVGSNLQQVDFKVVQGGGETRVAAAAGVPPIIVGLSEGLASATYSNYSTARRRFADGTLHPLWTNLAGSMQRLVTVPNGSRLWCDTRDVPFLREDSKDAAEIAMTQASTMRSLIEGGFDPDSVQRAVMSGDYGLLSHTGLVSVQLRQPGADDPAQNPAPSSTPAAKPDAPAKPAAKPATTKERSQVRERPGDERPCAVVGGSECLNRTRPTPFSAPRPTGPRGTR